MTIYRPQDVVPKIFKKLNQKTPKYHKQLQQNCKIQNLSTKISCLSVHQQ
jgi:hypothetical protein